MKIVLVEGIVERQTLRIPELVEMDESSADRLLARAGELAELGLVLEGFGTGCIMVREVPALLGQADVKPLVRDLAEELAELGETLVLRIPARIDESTWLGFGDSPPGAEAIDSADDR